jgi:hypothetical protein
MNDHQAGSHAGDTSDGASGSGSSAGTFEVILPDSPNWPAGIDPPAGVPAQHAPDRPDLAGPLTTSSASSLIRPRTRHAG